MNDISNTTNAIMEAVSKVKRRWCGCLINRNKSAQETDGESCGGLFSWRSIIPCCTSGTEFSGHPSGSISKAHSSGANWKKDSFSEEEEDHARGDISSHTSFYSWHRLFSHPETARTFEEEEIGRTARFGFHIISLMFSNGDPISYLHWMLEQLTRGLR